MSLATKVFGVDNEFFDERGKPRYMDDKYFKGLYYKYINERERSRRKKGVCALLGCNKKCVSSHTIPEGAVLKRISKNNEVFYPKYNSNIDAYERASVGINKASVFPGFCDDHEGLFSGFENTGDFKHPSMALQNLRVICKYYHGWKAVLKVFERTLQRYRKELEAYQNEKIALLNAHLSSDVKLLSIKDENTERMEGQIAFIKLQIADIHNNDLYPYIKTIEGDGEYVSVMYIDLNVELPICLAGKSAFYSEGKKYVVHLSVFPHANGTFCCFSVNKDFESYFLLVLDRYEDDYEFIGFLESWMIYGTDSWYINPDKWNSLDKDKQERILSELRIEDYYPDKVLDFLIFETERESIVRESE